MNERARRIGDNEVLYREVNERVRSLQEEFGLDDERAEFVCECGDIDCTQRITLSLPEYEEIRAHPARFAVVEGHQIPDVEHVVARNERYTTIEKDPGGPQELATAEDPRS